MLEKITSPKDLKNLSDKEINILAGEIRGKILKTVRENGGHLSSNLGMVETTLALHRVFDSPDDAIVFDVGHQCYTHKLLTGRFDDFSSLRQFGGISGFTNREESPHDFLTAGHSGSALPAALGIARANALSRNGHWAVAVIGDGSFTNGMVYETLNSCADEKLPLIIILNDNEMSISRNVGSVSHYFDRLRNSRKYFALKHQLLTVCRHIPILGGILEKCAYHIKEFFKNLFLSKNMFESMGLYYMGPVDGHDEAKLEAVIREAKKKDYCTLIHIITIKGKGFEAAEKSPDSYHFTDSNSSSGESFSKVFAEKLTEKAAENEKIAAITAAMDKGTGLSLFKEKFPDRFFDVGIAEECAVSLCGGLSAGGILPVAALYSTFLQRTFDQILEDVSLQKAHCVLAIDRAGLVSGDGVTHQGVFDVSLLSAVPGITLYSPETFAETEECLEKCLSGEGLCALRYPKGCEREYDRSSFSPAGDTMTVCGEGDIAVITYGRITANVYEGLKDIPGIKIIKLIRLLPLDTDELIRQCRNAGKIVVIEEGTLRGGTGEAVAALFSPMKIPVYIRAIEGFLPHGTVEELEGLCGFTPEQIKEFVKAIS